MRHGAASRFRGSVVRHFLNTVFSSRCLSPNVHRVARSRASFPMLVRNVLLTLAAHAFFSPKWTPRIHDGRTRNLIERIRERGADVNARTKVERRRRSSGALPGKSQQPTRRQPTPGSRRARTIDSVAASPMRGGAVRKSSVPRPASRTGSS
jgi:hypothetical protein